MSEELTEAQIAELHNDLRALRASLIAVAKTTDELAATVELDQSAVGRLSRIDAIQQQKMAQAQQQRNRLRLQQIAVALRLFDDDEYGWCRKCGDSIKYRRLKARPESPACMSCMLEIERGHAH
ncbi:MAG: TraR/DksA family transcriptional regulator [Rhodobacterales bacterium]|nr:TraR/DksA family transcriptional regulator [Rhodobacterales bacterium]